MRIILLCMDTLYVRALRASRHVEWIVRHLASSAPPLPLSPSQVNTLPWTLEFAPATILQVAGGKETGNVNA